MTGTDGAQRGQVTRKFIPVEEVAKEWMKDPTFVAAYDALEDEFAIASSRLAATPDMTEEQARSRQSD